MVTAKATAQLLPILLYMTVAYVLIIMGFFALLSDHPVVHHECGKTYHVWKYGLLNLLLWVFAVVSYCAMHGGGEGARARAMVLTIFYFAFSAWGALIWQHMATNSACWNVMEERFHVIFQFHHACTILDGMTGIFLFFHEAFIGKMVGADLTIMADVQHRLNATQPPPPKDGFGNNINYQGIPAAMKGTKKQGLSMAPPPSMSTNLAPQISYEYDKIMQNTQPQASSSSMLLQNEP